MALDTINLIISAPNITPGDAQALFGDTDMTVYGACTSPQINGWSRYKPIYYAGVTGVNFNLRAIGYAPNRHGLISKSYASWTALVNGLISGGKLVKITDWTYNRAALKSALVPKRIGDLDGYYHNATPPFAGFFCPPTLGNQTAGSQQKAYLLPSIATNIGADNPTAPGSIGIDQIATPALGTLIDTTLDKLYFGVALINAGSSPAVKWVASENAPVDSTTGAITHIYEVAMALSGLAAGTYYAIPILTRAKVTGLITDPRQICLVPNCAPLEIKVTSSATINEDIAVTITSCTFIPAADDSGNGIVKTTVHVKSDASYNKSCTYEAYTIAKGATTHANVQSGSFNLPAGQTHTFTYNVLMSAATAESIMVGVTVKSKRFDGVTDQTLTATRAPLVPDI